MFLFSKFRSQLTERIRFIFELIFVGAETKTLVLTSKSTDELNYRKSDRTKESSPYASTGISRYFVVCWIHSKNKKKTKSKKEREVKSFG